MRENLQKTVIWGVVLSEASHVFCCVFPTVFSLLSLAVGMGLAASVPVSMVWLHDLLHQWELPIIAFSGLMLVLGWSLMWYGRRVDCHDTGCAHGACAPKKSKARLIMIGATVLFLFNLGVYTFVHRSGLVTIGEPQSHVVEGIDGHNHE